MKSKFAGIMMTGILFNFLLITSISADTTPSSEQPPPDTAVTSPPSTSSTTPAPPAPSGSTVVAPTGFKADTVSQADQINMRWDLVEGAKGYALFRDGQKIADLPGTAIEYKDTSVEPNVTYSYTLQAIDGSGNSSDTASITVDSLDTLPPIAPSIVKGKAAASNQNHLIWTPATDNREVAKYQIYVSRNGGPYTMIDVVKVTHYIHDGLGPGIRYQYKVTAIDSAGNESQFSQILTLDMPNDPFHVVYKKLPLSVSLQD